MTVFVPGTLTNPLNVSGLGLWKHRRWSKSWRERTGTVILLTWGPRHGINPREAKVITLTAHVARKFDPVNLGAVFKPVIDALQDMLVIHSDGPECGHTFHFRQVTSKPAHRGVDITVEVAS